MAMLAIARTAWPAIVGDELARASEPVMIVSGDVLTIRTTGADVDAASTVAHTLALMEADIVRALADVAPVKRLRFRVAQRQHSPC